MKRIKSLLTPALVLVLSGVVVYDHLVKPYASPTVPVARKVDGAALGRAYAPVVTATLAEAWLAAAKTLEDGKSVADAQSVLQETWRSGRTDHFKAKVAPEFDRVLAEGKEPKDAEERAAAAKLWRDFAKGLKGGR